MTIIPLAHRPDLAAVVAQWLFDEWGNFYPGGTVNGWLDHIRTRMNADRIPMTVIAVDDRGEPIGTVALVENDMNTHPELSPWLGGVYVIPTARGRGVASAVINHVIKCAEDLGIRNLYLYTNGSERLYRRLGWQRVCREPYMGRDVTLMVRTPSSGREPLAKPISAEHG
jgi:GNAT superfamily N-acetyltransferase